METFKKHEVYAKVPLEERRRITRRAPVEVKFVEFILLILINLKKVFLKV